MHTRVATHLAKFEQIAAALPVQYHLGDGGRADKLVIAIAAVDRDPPFS